MKKCISLILVFAMCLGMLSGCGEQKGDDSIEFDFHIDEAYIGK